MDVFGCKKNNLNKLMLSCETFVYQKKNQMDSNFKEQEKRIKEVFPKKIKEIWKCEETIELYKKYLEKELELPIILTGIEDFSWEEFYVFGPGSKKEYEQLKKTRPSFTDKFILNKIHDDIDEHYGLFVKVTRETDKKKFVLPLADLKIVDKKSKNYKLLDDYSVWAINY